MRERVDRLAACEELNVESSALPTSAQGLSDQSVLNTLAELSAVINDATRLQAVLAGVAAQRSRREERGDFSTQRGHASPVSLIQSITGGTKADAARQVRVGSALLEVDVQVSAGAEAVDGGAGGDGGCGDVSACAEGEVGPGEPWNAPLRRALLDGRLTSAQHDAIQRGLGEPVAAVAGGASSAAVREAWSLAADGLVDEASGTPVEELSKRARTVRDLLDPCGAEERYARRFENRSLRSWVDKDGQHHTSIVHDDEMALWVQAILDAGLRPRRGGPRFLTDGERAAAAELVADARTNEQIAYDLFMDIVRAGALAHAGDVFGARQPGVRMVVVKDAVGPRDPMGRLLAVGHAEDRGDALPGSVIDRNLCAVGSRDVTVDGCGNPLDVGREQRLYTSSQRVALAVRDGGCIWPECTRPASYCEAHHCDTWSADRGRTDIDRGVLLCRFHHLALHNQGWRITRDRTGPFVLHRPPGDGPPIVLESKAAWRWAWDPPPPPDRGRWREPGAVTAGAA